MRIVAVIQARMGSNRLPGKVLMPLAGAPVLAHVVKRVSACTRLDEVVVATTVRAIDDPLADMAASMGVHVVRGDEDDVLDRYGLAAQESCADAIVRVTADCPLIDPDVLRAMVRRFEAGRHAGLIDLLTNARVRSFPRGLDVEMFSRDALEQMLVEADEPHQREHVTPFLYEHPERFRIQDHIDSADNSDQRWTLDTKEDYILLTKIFEALPLPDELRLRQVLNLLRRNPDWFDINAHIEQKKTKEDWPRHDKV